MSELTKALKPFDVVTDEEGGVGFIQEVSLNEDQEDCDSPFEYSVIWLTGDNDRNAWFDHEELEPQCNLFIKLAEAMCHPMGDSVDDVQPLFTAMVQA